MGLSPGLLEDLACPRCKGRLLLTPRNDALGCERCRIAYPVDDGIPVMIVEEAVPWEPNPGPGSSGTEHPPA